MGPSSKGDIDWLILGWLSESVLGGNYCGDGAVGICACTSLYPAGTSKCDGSTGADEKFEVLIWVSIKMALVGCAAF